jgi:hypothetical protein
MTRFLDVRVSKGGGPLATAVAINQWTKPDYTSLSLAQLQADIRGKHVLIATHGFNVDRQSGIDSLSNWESLLQLVPSSIFVGLLWPGDSVWLHGLAYPGEPKVANETGQLVAPFIEQNFTEAASISFASHSLGARVILQTMSKMTRKIRTCTLMAGAIDDNCLTSEFKTTTPNIEEISVLASKKDKVLSAAFPIGNILGGIIAAGHPWWHSALGHSGPATPWPTNFEAPFMIPDKWDYGHGNYLQIDASHPVIPLPENVPPEGTPEPAAEATGWQEAFSAAFASTRFNEDTP